MQTALMGTVTVDEAIKKGRIQLFWVPVFILLGSLAITMIPLCSLEDGTIWIPICGFSGFGLAVTLPFLYCGIMLPRWRIWAFTNVRNVHELKQTARLRQIYPKDKSFLWRLEIKNAEQKRLISELEQKFDLPDIFEDDYTIPYETAYAYSKIETLFVLLFTVGAAVGTVVFLLQREVYIGLLMLACSLIFGYATYKRYRTPGPLLVISNDGITTKDNGFHPWREIQNEQVFYVSAGKASYYGLSYEVNGGTIKMSLKELTGLSSYKVDHVLRTYRGRFQANNQPARSPALQYGS
jgi:hypothetical protein